MSDLRPAVQSALQALASGPLRDSAKNLLKTLGYQSDRTLNLEGSKPQAFLDLIASQGGQSKFDESKALFSDWKSADILFQLSDTDISQERSLFKDTTVQPGLLQSYLFFAIELTGGDYARGKLTSIARQINRVFPMPVMLLIRHGDTSGTPVLSIAVINRRRNKVHAEKDVLEKVTLIRDISLTDPHRGHLDILASFAVENLVHPKKLPITDFDSLHAAWEQIFNIELLNARFYRELSNWYFWALPQVEFPADLEPDDEKRRATGLIRLLTRLIFCWFLKEKNLIPEKLFHPADLEKILKGFDTESETSSTYYQAILQNLFFATLNQRMGKDGSGKPYRLFATDEGFAKNRATYDVNNLYRYEKLFAGSQDDALAHFADIPFLNGGLFECLDRTEDGTDKKRYLDGFSRNDKKRPHIPDRLFFDSGETADLSEVYGDKKRKAEKVTGLITILNRYKFTIVENTPIDQEIALDPELLGKVFENLLASYNEETKTTARKQTGSFYTPRPIVDYMVDESLKAHLERKLVEGGAHAPSRVVSDAPVGNRSASPVDSNPTPVSCQSSARAPMTAREARALPIRERLDLLFAYTEDVPDFSELEKATLIAAIDALKILDPACGSGAFPMGVLHKLVYILGKLDPDNDRWKQTQLAKLDSAPMREELERAFADNNDDYGRKLYLIENCLYGVDIQPIAIQITKLRFFISLVCDQKTNRNKKDNHGIRPLPNLETKFVAANTLIGLPEMDQMELVDPRVYKIEADIETLYHSHFSIQRRDQKLAVQGKVKALRKEMADLLAQSLMSRKKSEHIAEWNPFDPQSSADFFDSHWMFGRALADGFDVVIGNPPYGLVGSNQIAARAYYTSGRFRLSAYKINLYLLFLERGLELLMRSSGILSFIIPKSLVFNSYFDSARRILLTEYTIPLIVEVRDKVFEAAEVGDSVLFFASTVAPNPGSKLEYKIVDSVGADNESDSVEFNCQCDLAKTTGVQFRRPSFEPKKPRNTLGDLWEVSNGLNPGNVKDILLSTTKLSPKHRKMLLGRDLQRYSLQWSGTWVNFDPSLKERIKPSDTKSKKGMTAQPRVDFALRSPEIYKANKVMVRKTADHIVACLDNDTFCFDSLSYGIQPKDPRFSPKFLLGLLNSKFLGKIHGDLSQNKDKVFAKVLAENLRKLPVPDIDLGVTADRTSHDLVVSLVDRILAAKQANPAADTSDLEREIDQQVYALYGLTPEEIAIVEGTAP